MPATTAAQSKWPSTVTAFLRAVQSRGCVLQVGSVAVFEQVPAYIKLFGFGRAAPNQRDPEQRRSALERPNDDQYGPMGKCRLASALCEVQAPAG
jgi:hypothetical protein